MEDNLLRLSWFKRQNSFGMGGYGGKAILIDVEDPRIVILHLNIITIKDLNIILKNY